ncbi:hypothetical protein MMC19_004293 [Ptychographa xylographoides]|nr:hypothetical protein [Ptychographa xylographoides]
MFLSLKSTAVGANSRSILAPVSISQGHLQIYSWSKYPHIIRLEFIKKSHLLHINPVITPPPFHFQLTKPPSGTGGVGTAFLDQLAALTPAPPISLVLISRSSKSLSVLSFSEPLALPIVPSDLAASTQPALTPSEILAYLENGNLTGSKCVLIDNTSNQKLAESYPSFLSRGISIVTPNKKAFSGPLDLWQDIHSASYPQTPKGGLCYHESTVGAGLPIISTLKDLIATGDKVTKIEGVFSGTMSFLFNNFAPLSASPSSGGAGGKWSAEVAKAKALGFTEPDPRDDLNGLDVARKLVILARLAGLDIQDTSAFPVESLIPTALESCESGDEFMARLPEFDAQMEAMKDAAEKEGKVVRYVGSIDVVGRKLRVGLERLDRGHPVAGLSGSDNIVNFYTERYGARPLIVQGAGAGAEVTAMGVTADLLKVLERIR